MVSSNCQEQIYTRHQRAVRTWTTTDKTLHLRPQGHLSSPTSWMRNSMLWASEPCLVLTASFRVFSTLKESESEVAQSCPTLCDPMGCSPPGSSVHGISQARILEWAAIFFSRGSFRPRDRTIVFFIVRWILYHGATREALINYTLQCKINFFKNPRIKIYRILEVAFKKSILKQKFLQIHKAYCSH